MPNFIDDETPLPYPKETLKSAPSGSGSKYIRASDWNTLCQALIDTRGAVIELQSGGSGLFGAVLSEVTTAANTGFSTWWYQFTGSTVGDGVSGIWLRTLTTGGFNHWTARSKPVPATPYTITLLVNSTVSAGTGGTVFIGWSEAATGAANKAHAVYYTPLQSAVIGHIALLNATTTSSTANLAGPMVLGTNTWWRLADNGTTVTVEVSSSGDPDTFITVLTQLKSSGYLGASGYSHLLFGNINLGGTMVTQMLSYSEE